MKDGYVLLRGVFRIALRTFQVQPPSAALLVDGDDLAQALFIADHLPGPQALPIADGVDYLVLVDDALGIKVLTAAALGALGETDCYPYQRPDEFVVVVPLLGISEDFDTVIKHDRRELPATAGAASPPRESSETERPTRLSDSLS